MEPIVKNWSLYTCSMKCGRAIRSLNCAMERAVKKLAAELKRRKLGPDDDENIADLLGKLFTEIMDPVLRKYSAFGSYDTEPIYQAGQGLINATKDFFEISRDEPKYEWGKNL